MNASSNPEIIIAAESIVAKACELNGEAAKKGGHICVSRPDNEVILVSRLGVVDDRARADRTLSFCQEKVRRLSGHKDHVSSYQSRNIEQNMYGGGIRLEDGMMVAFSGLPELWDEACMLTLALKLRGLKELTPHMKRIVAASNNPHVSGLMKACL